MTDLRPRVEESVRLRTLFSPAMASQALTFRREEVPRLPARLSWEAVVMKKKYWTYEHYFRADLVDVFSSREDYEAFGLALTSMLLHGVPESVDIDLLHPMSDIRSLRIRAPAQRFEDIGSAVGISTIDFKPLGALDVLSYFGVLAEKEKPRFLLCHPSLQAALARSWSERDHIALESSQDGLLLLTASLLRFAREEQVESELNLRPPPAYDDCLGAGSSIVRFWLPGSVAWREEYGSDKDNLT